MNNTYEDKLILLQERIPVELRHGLALLEKTNGDLEKAEQLFQEERITLIMNRAEVTADVALRHLYKNKFYIKRTIDSIDEERYTLTERILKKSKDKKEEALDNILYAIHEKYGHRRNLWKPSEDVPKEIHSFVICMEWVNFVDWEGYESALAFNLEIAVDQFENQLKLQDLALSLRMANDIRALIHSQNESDKGLINHIKASCMLHEDKTFKECQEDFMNQRPMVMERLYELVKNNIIWFP